jgi:ribonuclease P protein component
MLPAAHRLRTAADFRDTTRRGTKVPRGSVVVYLAPPHGGSPEEAPPPRVGLIVGKNVGGSVQRHRAARRIRAVVAPLLAALPTGSTVVIRALPGADIDPELADHVSRGLRAGVERLDRGRTS